MSRRTLYPLEVRNGLLFLREFSALGQTIEQFRAVGFNLPKNVDAEGLLGMNFMRNCKAIVDTGNAYITMPNLLP